MGEKSKHIGETYYFEFYPGSRVKGKIIGEREGEFKVKGVKTSPIWINKNTVLKGRKIKK